MIELALLPQHLQLEPGGIGRATIALHTPDEAGGAYKLTLFGLEESWYTLSLTWMDAAPGLDAQAILTLHPAARRAPGRASLRAVRQPPG